MRRREFITLVGDVGTRLLAPSVGVENPEKRK
jgi:hypothetical protein